MKRPRFSAVAMRERLWVEGRVGPVRGIGGEVLVEEVAGPLAVLGRDRGPDPGGAPHPFQATGDLIARSTLPREACGVVRRTSAVIVGRR